MEDKVILDKEYYEKLVKFAEEGEYFKTNFINAVFYIREALSRGVLIPNDDALETRKRISLVLEAFEFFEQECNEKHSDHPSYDFAEVHKKDINQKPSLKLIK